MRFSDVFCCRQLATIVLDPESTLLHSSFDVSFLAVDCPKSYLVKDVFFQRHMYIYCCPWCGQAIPEDFLDKWYVFVKKQIGPDYNLDPYYFEKMPTEFQTDEWWRNRNLKLILKKPFDNQAQIKHTEDFCNQANNEQSKLSRRVKFLEKDLKTMSNLEQFCCIKLYDEVHQVFDGKKDNTFFPIMYEKEKRRFFMPSISLLYLAYRKRILNKTVWRLLKLQIYYCFWCGKELPKSLSKEWVEIVTKKFGVKNVYSKAELQKKLPAKFLTDEWWREAGL